MKGANFTVDAKLHKAKGVVRIIFKAKSLGWELRFGNLPALRNIDKSSPFYRIADFEGLFVFSTNNVNAYRIDELNYEVNIVKGLNYASRLFLRKATDELNTLASLLHDGPENSRILIGPVDQTTLNLIVSAPAEYPVSGCVPQLPFIWPDDAHADIVCSPFPNMAHRTYPSVQLASQHQLHERGRRNGHHGLIRVPHQGRPLDHPLHRRIVCDQVRFPHHRNHGQLHISPEDLQIVCLVCERIHGPDHPHHVPMLHPPHGRGENTWAITFSGQTYNVTNSLLNAVWIQQDALQAEPEHISAGIHHSLA